MRVSKNSNITVKPEDAPLNNNANFSSENIDKLLLAGNVPSGNHSMPVSYSNSTIVGIGSVGAVSSATVSDEIVGEFRQGGIGDCWYLAAIKSLSVSSAGSQALNSCITPGTGSSKVTFQGAVGFSYGVTSTALLSEVNDGDTYSSSGHSSGDADVLLLEMGLKAYTASTTYKNAQFTSSAYTGGWMSQALSLITGKVGATFNNWSNNLAATTAKLDELAKIIDHTAITAACMNQANQSLDIAASSHAYSIVAIDSVNKTVSFRNPWYTGTVLKNISYANFSQYFQRIDYVDLSTNNKFLMASNSGGSLAGGTGNDMLYGGTGSDKLNGSSGSDTMYGGKGSDTYYIDSAGDYIVEYGNEGTDTVVSTISYNLYSVLENLTLSGSSNINGGGNDLNNILVGNSGNNVLDGGYGNDVINGSLGTDTMLGGAGDDIYFVDNTGDVITESSGAGADAVISTISYTLANNVEKLTLSGTAAINGTGNSLSNYIVGNTSNNVINGSSGSDTMLGGAGNDTYYVDSTGDVVTENASAGTDKVISSISYTLGNNLENLTLSGSSAINGTGNSLNNYISGNSANNVINGGAGNDTMLGGAGNDTYYVNSSTDVVTENSDAGTDTVISSVGYTLGNNLENLTLSGTALINGTGNTLNNSITGNSANNILSAGLGNDTLTGGVGNDSLLGGAGDDTYSFSAANGKDVISDASGTDIIKFGSNVLKQSVAFFKSGVNLIVGYANGDRITIQNQSTATNSIEQFQLSSNEYLTNANINSIIGQIASYATENGVQINSIENVIANQDLMAIVSNSWQSAMNN